MHGTSKNVVIQRDAFAAVTFVLTISNLFVNNCFPSGNMDDSIAENKQDSI